MQFLPKSIKLVDTNGSETDNVVSVHVEEGKEAIPQEFKIHLCKRKGNPQFCDNHRGTSLLSIAGKILANSYRTTRMCILIRLNFYQKVSVGSGNTEE